MPIYCPMKRREFIAGLAGAAATWPLGARAQHTAKLLTIGFLGSGTLSSQGQWPAAFMQRLRERGFRSGWEFAAWLGLVPPQNSTGGKNRLGGVSKRGNQYLRPLLINGASANAGHSDANYTEIYVLYRNRS
jgi:transposase